MNKGQSSNQLARIFESLSDITVTLVADLVADVGCSGTAVAVRLAELGVSVLPVGVVGEDEAGQRVLKALHDRRVSTSGINRIKNYETPAGAIGEPIHGEHPALLNIIEHARKFASASDAMYVCDYGVGGSGPRVLNFIKSNGCVREKTLVARSLHRLADFEQLTAAVAGEVELERAIGAEIGANPEKLAVAAGGMLEELGSGSLVAVSAKTAVIAQTGHEPVRLALARVPSTADVDFMGGVFAAALAAGAEGREAAELAIRILEFHKANADKKPGRAELIDFLSHAKASRRAG